MEIIPLSQGKESFVSGQDYDRLVQWKWCARFDGYNWYATARVNGKQTSMHTFIMNPPRGMVVDHINGNGLDNRRENLRICTQAQNLRNRRGFSSTGYKGVSEHRQYGRTKYQVKIRVNGTLLHVGLFKTPEQAARAYDTAARKYFGEYARLNFPEGDK